MKKYYVECGERDWVIVCDDAILKDGHLLFLKNHLLVAAFNCDKWDAIKFIEDCE